MTALTPLERSALLLVTVLTALAGVANYQSWPAVPRFAIATLALAGLAIYDTMNFVKPDIATMVVGVAMSMGSLLLAGGTKGKRAALPNIRILIHQPSAGFEGQSTDIEIHAREILKVRERIDEIYAEHTGRPKEEVRRDMERDRFFNAQQALEYGLVDRVLESH